MTTRNLKMGWVTRKLDVNILPNVSCTKTSLGCTQRSQAVKIINKKKIDK